MQHYFRIALPSRSRRFPVLLVGDDSSVGPRIVIFCHGHFSHDLERTFTDFGHFGVEETGSAGVAYFYRSWDERFLHDRVRRHRLFDNL